MKSFSNLKNIKQFKQFFFQFVEKNQEVFWIRDADYKTPVYVNPAYYKIWKNSDKNLYTKPYSWLDHVHADDRKWLENEISQISQDPTKSQWYKHEYRIHQEHSVKQIQEMSTALFNAQGKCIGFVGTARDVTNNWQNFTETDKANLFFRIFTEKSNTVFWARDALLNQQIFLSPGYEKIWGRSCEELYNNPTSWIQTLIPEDRLQFSASARLEKFKEQGAKTEYEDRYRIITPKGETRWIKDVSFPIYDKKNDFLGFAGIAEDITSEVKREQELRAAKDAAESANQVKSDFLAMVSHELRTPLNAIIGITQILKTKNIPHDIVELIDIIGHAGNNLLSIVSDILDFARLEVGKLTFYEDVFNIKKLFQQFIQGYQYQAETKQIKLSLEFEPELPVYVLGDAKRLQQILMNLVSNSLKFTNAGYIKIFLSAVKQTDQHALFTLSVIDSGIGIPEEKLESVFEKFSQVDSIYQRNHSGIGLGLSIVKQLVEAMNGKIIVTSVLGKGSTFKASFKLKLTKEKPDQELQDQHFSRPTYDLNILLVEDNIINQKIAVLMLEHLGCKVTVFSDGEEVFKQIDKLVEYDIIFMDIGLPDINGLEISRRLRECSQLNHIPIIAMTAHILEREQKLALSSGMNKIIAKPINSEELKRVLNMYASKKRN